MKANLITTRRIVFTPSVEVKDELKNTAIQITCLDENGEVLKRVTSGDSGEVEDNEGNENGSENGSEQNGGSDNGDNNGGSDNNGGDNNSGDNNSGGFDTGS